MTLQSKDDQPGKQPPATPLDAVVSKTREQFSQACATLWDTEVRTALIFQKNIQLCRACLGIFIAGQEPSSHPQEHVVSLIKVCRDHKISRPECFETFLAHQSAELMPDLGYYPLPAMSPSHRTLPKTAPPTSESLEIQQVNLKVGILSERIEIVTRERDWLSAENKILKEEISVVIHKLLEERKSKDSVLMRAQIKISELTGLFSEQEDGCNAAH